MTRMQQVGGGGSASAAGVTAFSKSGVVYVGPASTGASDTNSGLNPWEPVASLHQARTIAGSTNGGSTGNPLRIQLLAGTITLTSSLDTGAPWLGGPALDIRGLGAGVTKLEFTPATGAWPIKVGSADFALRDMQVNVQAPGYGALLVSNRTPLVPGVNTDNIRHILIERVTFGDAATHLSNFASVDSFAAVYASYCSQLVIRNCAFYGGAKGIIVGPDARHTVIESNYFNGQSVGHIVLQSGARLPRVKHNFFGMARARTATPTAVIDEGAVSPDVSDNYSDVDAY